MAAIVTGCATAPDHSDWVPSSDQVRELAGPGGYSYEEAQQFIEFCVELDDQDDRTAPGAPAGASANVDPQKWRLLYDSRKAVDEDYFAYMGARAAVPANGTSAALPDDSIQFWQRLFSRIESEAAARHIRLAAAGDVAASASLNGFGPWQNAWLLYQGVGENAGRYAIAIRGTVFETEPSAVENGLFQPAEARDFLSRAVSFARAPNATVHSGFAHATFTLLLDRRYGILPVIEREVPPGSVLYIVGHSQGAAMVTLVHAFLFYGMSDAESSGKDPLGLKGKRWRLKSYGFAQPKPGNYTFSADFASYTQVPDTAIVINNDLDAVPQLPLTLQSTADLEGDFHGKFILARVVYGVSAGGRWLRTAIGSVLEWQTVRSARGYGHFFRYDSLLPWQRLRSGFSWGFVPAGRVIIVYGKPQADPGKDVFFQHHATTYRTLIAQQLGGRSQ
jgi:hypothetical protein